MGSWHRGLPRLLLMLGACLGPAPAQAPPRPAPADESREFMDFLELLNTPVVSASKTRERLGEAPATVLVLRAADLRARGYHQLSQVLDDLPGMQPVRPYGDYYLKNYWRGFRNNQGDPYLLMVDGLVLNSLFYNAVEWALVTLPLANVDRIEVVYGPASAVYGSNASMGVINVLTVKDRGVAGSGQDLRLTGGGSGLRVADTQFLHKSGDFRLAVAARLEDSVLDAEASQGYEYTRDRYYLDRRLWGRLAGRTSMGGPHHSETAARALDLRALWGGAEAGLMVHTLRSGYGNEYAADRAPNNQTWGRRHLSLWLRQAGALTEDLRGTTTLRHLQTGITPDSYFIERNTWTAGIPNGIDIQYYRVDNSSWSLAQDFEYAPEGRLSLSFGLRFERKDLQKGYQTTPAYVRSAQDFDPDAADFPQPLADAGDPRNRVATEDRGLYLQGRWRLDPAHSLVLGGRLDHNSIYGHARTLRAGYVGSFGPWGLKALFGQAYNEPTMASLYASWSASQANPDLAPERSSTLEVSGTYTRERFSGLLSLWSIHNTDTIIKTDLSRNLGEQDFAGLDLHLRALARPAWARQLSAWAYLSLVLRRDGSNRADHHGTVPPDGLTAGGRQVGDIARTQLKVGATLELERPLTLTLLARYVGPVEPVASNPAGRIGGHLTADAVLVWEGLFGAPGLGVTLKAANLADRRYAHPGLADASAGVVPGRWTGDSYQGSTGWYSSLLPQPGRSVQLTLGIRY